MKTIVDITDNRKLTTNNYQLSIVNYQLVNGGELSYNLNGMNGTTKEFQITDHLGNVRTVLTFKMTDSTTSMSSYDYKPFGDTLWTSAGSENRLGYIGRERDYENNYFSFGARNYDSETGRFLSVDPFFEAFPNQTPYHYAYNSPIQWKDPSGLAPVEEKKERVQWTEIQNRDIGGMDEISKMLHDIVDNSGRNKIGYYNVMTGGFENNANESMDAWDMHAALQQFFMQFSRLAGGGSSGGGSVGGSSGGSRRTSGDVSENGIITISIYGIGYTINYDDEKLKQAGITPEQIQEMFENAFGAIANAPGGYDMLDAVGGFTIDISYTGYELAERTSPTPDTKDENGKPWLGGIYIRKNRNTGSYGGTFRDGTKGWMYIAFEYFTGNVPYVSAYKFWVYEPTLFGSFYSQRGPFQPDLGLILAHEFYHAWQDYNKYPANDQDAWEFGITVWLINHHPNYKYMKW
ncbi:MAG: RHS repeat-associated core domain-containing protein [bacterium]